jgi:hypothetical protein
VRTAYQQLQRELVTAPAPRAGVPPQPGGALRPPGQSPDLRERRQRPGGDPVSPDLIALRQNATAALKRGATLTPEQQTALPVVVEQLEAAELRGLAGLTEAEDLGLLRSVLPQGFVTFRPALDNILANARFGGVVPWNGAAPRELLFLVLLDDPSFARIAQDPNPYMATLLAELNGAVPAGTVGPSSLEASEVVALLNLPTVAARVEALRQLAEHDAQQQDPGDGSGVPGADTNAPPEDEQTAYDPGAAEEEAPADELAPVAQQSTELAKGEEKPSGRGITGAWNRLNTGGKIAVVGAGLALGYIIYSAVTAKPEPAPRRRSASGSRQLPASNPSSKRGGYSAAAAGRRHLSDEDAAAIRRMGDDDDDGGNDEQPRRKKRRKKGGR